MLLALALTALTSGAASIEGSVWGVKGGLHFADLAGGGISGNEMKVVAGGGIFFNRAMTDIISIQPEVPFMLKGAKSETPENTGIMFMIGYGYSF